jgi:hypothetical protein
LTLDDLEEVISRSRKSKVKMASTISTAEQFRRFSWQPEDENREQAEVAYLGQYLESCHVVLSH